MLKKVVNLLLVISVLFSIFVPAAFAQESLGSCSSANPGFLPGRNDGPYCSPMCGGIWVTKGSCTPWPQGTVQTTPQTTPGVTPAPQPAPQPGAQLVTPVPQPAPQYITPSPAPRGRRGWLRRAGEAIVNFVSGGQTTPVQPAQPAPVYQTPGVTPAPRPTVIATVTPQPGVTIKVFRWPSAGEALMVVPLIAGVAVADDVSIIGVFDDPVAIILIAGIGTYAVGQTLVDGRSVQVVVQGYEGLLTWAGSRTGGETANPTPSRPDPDCYDLTAVQIELWKKLTSGGSVFNDPNLLPYLHKSSTLTSKIILEQNFDLNEVSRLQYFKQTFSELERGECWDFAGLEELVKSLGRKYGYNIP